MSTKKELKRAVKAVWDEVKALRSERSKLYTPSDITASADTLNQHVGQLRELSKRLGALSAMPPEAKPAKPRKSKKTS